ncbi:MULTISPECIES: SH3 domain-containing protein [unclassified Streptomyces]|uniref:SH3 domain-containing protein n=1 Tax=unclassified Streptomyces TaxID=2593676 RepID=UPI00332CCC80
MSVENESSQVQSLSGDGGPTFPTAPGYRVNVRSGPGTNYPIIDSVPAGGSVTIRCQCSGTTVSGPYGTTDLWDCIGNGRFVSDAYVHTGSDGYVAPRCG